MLKFYKRNKQQYLFGLLLCLFVLFVWTCKKDDNVAVAVFDPSKPVTIEKFLPDSGGSRTQLVIVGQNFGSDTSIVNVKVNGRLARVIGVKDTRIYAVVPSRAGTGKVEVSVGPEGSQVAATSSNDFSYRFTQNVSTVCGQTDPSGTGANTDGTLANAWFLYPYYLTIDRDNNIFVTERKGIAFDKLNAGSANAKQCYRYVAIDDNQVSTVFTASGSFSSLRTTAFNNAQDTLWCVNDSWSATDPGLFTLTRKQGWFDPKTNAIIKTTNGVAVNPVDGTIVYSRFEKSLIFAYNPQTKVSKSLTTFGENLVTYMCFSPDGKYLYFAMSDGNQTERGRVYRAQWFSSTQTLGDPTQIVPFDYLKYAEQIACDKDGNLYICASANHTIEIWDPVTQTVKTFAGIKNQSGYVDGLPLKSKFNCPTGICIGADGSIYVADNGNHRIRKIVVD